MLADEGVWFCFKLGNMADVTMVTKTIVTKLGDKNLVTKIW